MCPPPSIVSATTPATAADLLVAAIEDRRAPVCVGLDPVVARLPEGLRPSSDAGPAAVQAIESFCVGVVDAALPHVPAIKPQSACFERHGSGGVAVLERICRRIRDAGGIVILDAKRGDIGTTAAHYGAAAAAMGAHWMTASPYLGMDGIEPLLEAGLGVFGLVRTSNPSGDRLQSTAVGAVAGAPVDPAHGPPATVADAVADMLRVAGDEHVGQSGWSGLGAVVGATRPADAATLRTRLPRQLFLVPGYGAQGGGVDDVIPCFAGGGTGGRHGAIVTASRSVIYAPASAGQDWTDAVAAAAEQLAVDVGSATGWR